MRRRRGFTTEHTEDTEGRQGYAGIDLLELTLEERLDELASMQRGEARRAGTRQEERQMLDAACKGR